MLASVSRIQHMVVVMLEKRVSRSWLRSSPSSPSTSD